VPFALVAWIYLVSLNGLGWSLSAVEQLYFSGRFLDLVSFNGPVRSF